MTHDLGASWLFVPGNRPKRFSKAVASGADEVILDLEDAVVAADKAAARDHVTAWLASGNEAWVRINAPETRYHDDDLRALVTQGKLRGVVVPKAASSAAIERAAAAVPEGAGILPLVESAAGVAAATALASGPRVQGLAFGSLDFALDVDADHGRASLAFARGALVVAARAAGRPGPIDGVTLETHDESVVSSDADHARRLGFSGKLCIHPAQVSTVNAAFSPTAEQVASAERLLAHARRDAGGATTDDAFTLDGRIVDKPLLDRARRILARVERA